MSIFRSGLRSLLPEGIKLISGPGCPVCVTDQGEIDQFIELSRTKDIIIATFGDLLKVPGTDSSLQKERAVGADIRVVYSSIDAVEIAKKNLDKQIVFLGVGFETTAPTIAASIISANQQGITNYSVFSCHKLVPPALSALMSMEGVSVDGFILPGHVSVIIGKHAYEAFFNNYRMPCVITGFEPVDILQAIMLLVDQLNSEKPALVNAYKRAVTDDGNKKAIDVMLEVFDVTDARWRGVGSIPKSGLEISERYNDFDAKKRFQIEEKIVSPIGGCVCGSILTGRKIPPDCKLFRNKCTPENPIGPCMVSTEGTCAAYFKYN